MKNDQVVPMGMSAGSGTMGVDRMVLTPMMATMMSTSFNANAKLGLALSSVTSLTLGVLADVNYGLADPLAGVNLHFGLGGGFMGMASLEGAIPVSKFARESSRITTVIVSAGPMYMDNGFSAGLTGYGAYSFYGTSGNQGMAPNMGGMGNMGGMNDMNGMNNVGGMVTPRAAAGTPGGSNMMTPPTMNAMAGMSALPLMEHGGMLTVGIPIVRRLTASASAGASVTYRDDDTYGWMTNATPLRLTLAIGGLTASSAFSLLSDMKNDRISLPSRPLAGFQIQYIFGNGVTLGGGADACMH